MKSIFTAALLFLGLSDALRSTHILGLKKEQYRKALRGNNVDDAEASGPHFKPQPCALTDWDSPSKRYCSHNFSVPIDHFHNESKYAPHTNRKFNLRYWFDPTYYKEGGPVILFESGEADANDRMPILYSGIVYLLARATGGLGVIIEHRYYGTSQPMPNLSTENLRFLTTDQAMADNAYFAQNIVFPGMEHLNLTSHTTPWILYGGSYSGAFVAFSRKLYPDVFWGAISSSGVVEAIWDYWAYWEPIRHHAPQTCVKYTEFLINAMDNIFMKMPKYGSMLKKAFNMESISHATDFSYILSEYGIGDWQATNWNPDPAVDYPGFEWYCGNLTSQRMLYPEFADRRETVQELLTAGGYGDKQSLDSLTTAMLNFIGFAQPNIVKACPYKNLDKCFNTYGPKPYADRSLANNGLISWPYQYCTQWGFLQTGSGAPSNQLTLISRLVDLEYSSIICREAFGLDKPADVDAIRAYGGYKISYPRLAIIDGVADPWRYACPHSPAQRPWNRADTLNQPFYLIGNGSVHHWDENGLRPKKYTDNIPPEMIREIQTYEVEFVKHWLVEYEVEKKKKAKKNPPAL